MQYRDARNLFTMASMGTRRSLAATALPTRLQRF